MTIKEIEKIFEGMLGVKFLGIQNLTYLGLNDVILFNDLYTNSTLGLYSQDLTQENIKQKVIESRLKFKL